MTHIYRGATNLDMPNPADPDVGPDDEFESLDPRQPGPPAAPATPAADPTTPSVPDLGFQTSAELDQLFAALAKAQGEIQGAAKSALNPAFKTADGSGRPYSTLADCWTACREPLAKNDLSIMQPPAFRGGSEVVVITLLGHKSGQWMRCAVRIPSDSKAQSIGSAITYARRYGLSSLVGIAPDEDDDGGEATAGATRVAEQRTARADAAADPDAQRFAALDRQVSAKWKILEPLLKQRIGHSVSPVDWKEEVLGGRPPRTAADLQEVLGAMDRTLADLKSSAKRGGE